MPLAGTIDRRAVFYRSTTGSFRLSGIASGVKGLIRKTVTGALNIVGYFVAADYKSPGRIERKLMAKRSLAGIIHISGVIARKAYFYRVTQGAVRFSAVVSGLAGQAVYGILTFTAGVVSRRVMFKRTVTGNQVFSGLASFTGAIRRRTVTGMLRLRGHTAIATGFIARGLTKLGQALRME